MFGVSFDEIAPIVGRSSTAARQLASRARRRVQGATPSSDADLQLVNQPVLVNGSAGVVVFADGKPYSVIGGKSVEINVLADPTRLSWLDLGGLLEG